MLDREGFIAEANGTHVFLVAAGAVTTSAADACPEGITRQTVLDICTREQIPCRIEKISQADAYRADEMFCTGTMGELAGVVSLDGRKIGLGEVGETTTRLSELFARETAESGYPVFE